MIGNIYGKWKVLSEAGRDSKSNQLYNCQCTCGTEKVHRKSTLIRGASTQCKKCRMKIHNKTEDLVGKKIGFSIVLKRLDNIRSNSCYLVRCGCGREKIAFGYKLRSGKGAKCPHCRVKTHGMSGTSTFKCWQDMLGRCLNENHQSFGYYGGRGITVCDRWLKFENFLEDMGKRPSNLSIDRINNDGNYEPDNCRWATMQVQASNKRNTIKNY